MGEITRQPTIHSITCSERMLEISYSEPGEQLDGAGLVRTIGISGELFPEEFTDFMDSMQSVLDAALTAYRLARSKD